jgi:imidazole glycerol-phosphate synthase subunit HisH
VQVALIDYGAGNLTSVRKGLAAAGVTPVTPGDPADLAAADAIVVPGVGHFAATSSLEGAWRSAIALSIEQGTPLLGICLGLQWLFDGSDEATACRGLGAMRGRCQRLPDTVKIPHVGWNSLTIVRPSPILSGIADGVQMYFTHSYAAPVTDDCVASSTHGAPFAAVVQQDRVVGVQFHPEKSGPAGLRLLMNFLDMVRATRTAAAVAPRS